MDNILVKDLEVYAYHGVLEEEKKVGQLFLVSFQTFFDLRDSSRRDDLMLSISYADLCQTVKSFMTSHTYDLIETVAEGIARTLLLTYDKIEKVSVTLKKPDAPIGEKVRYPAICINRSWHKVFIGLGSNMGERKEIIQNAITILDKYEAIRVKNRSSLIETEPWGNEDQSAFINCVCKIETWLSAKELMSLLLEIEKEFGRKRTSHWGPRTLDLDILFYDQLITDDPYIVIPHPLLHKRLFVLESLCELNPYIVHPLLRKRVIELKENLIKE